MASDEEVTQRAGSLRAMTGLTAPELAALLPHFEPAFLAYLEHYTRDGQPRTSRRDSTYETAPFPTMADKWLFIVTDVQQNPIQEVHGQLFGMSPAPANTWVPLLHTVLHQALAHQDLWPARTAAALVAGLAAHQAQEGTTSPRFGMMVLNAPSSVRKTLQHSQSLLVARRGATRSTTSC